jgi:hypothetical protein
MGKKSEMGIAYFWNFAWVGAPLNKKYYRNKEIILSKSIQGRNFGLRGRGRRKIAWISMRKGKYAIILLRIIYLSKGFLTIWQAIVDVESLS